MTEFNTARTEAEALAEASLQANANPDVIANEMAMVIRDLMRAASSEKDDGYKAAQQMERMIEYLTRCKEPLSWWRIFSDALTILRENLPTHEYESRYLDVAKCGMKFFVESSATDNAARGRAAKRLSELRDAIRWQEESRNRSPEQESTEQILQRNAQKLAGRSQ